MVDKNEPQESVYNTPKNVCTALTGFIIEIREQSAALRAYDNVFQNSHCDNSFMKRASKSIWRELLSEIARIFDNEKTGSYENCTLSRLKSLCCKEAYASLFATDEQNDLLQSLEVVFGYYNQLPIAYSRRKQLAHHDLTQIVAGECVGISFEQVEKLVEDVTNVFAKICTQFSGGLFITTFPNYDLLVEQYEKEIRKLIE